MLAVATGATGTGISGAAIVLLVFVLAITILEIASIWFIFIKAGHPGRAALVPFYNSYVLLKIVGCPAWWLLLYLVPLVNLVVGVVVLGELAKSFGYGGGFTLGLLVLPRIFFPVLAFGSDRYRGPGGISPRMGHGYT